MVYQTGTITFPSRSGSGPQGVGISVGFEKEIAQAAVVMTGYSVRYTGSDHHVKSVEVRLHSQIFNSTPNGPEVHVNGVLGLRDSSGNWDDAYEGEIHYCVIAEMKGRVIGPILDDLDLLAKETK